MDVKDKIKIDELPMGELTNVGTLIYYDYPRLIRYKDKKGNIYLSCATDETENTQTYVIYQITDTDYKLAKDGKIDALELFLRTKDSICYKEVLGYNGHDDEYYQLNIKNIPKEYLPIEGLILSDLL